ncbi:MAG: hypothetical protein IJK42_12450 [Prevotella sp.]|nr:hypothetical protein [Prevotella sp.]MBQ6210561.1 hypothetical protein [Prevotella sp.]
MKKVLLFFSLVALALNASADNYVTIDDVRVRPGGRADVVLMYHFDSERICAYQLDLQFPEGITADVANAVSGPTTPSTFIVGSNDLGNSHYRFATFSFGNGTGNEPITDHEGVLVSFTIYADASLTPGTELDASAYELIFPEYDGTQFDLPNVDFKIIIDENAGYVDLYDTEEAAPEDANDVDVRVYRAFTDGEWSTICLPFDMTEEQVKAAFGDGVELGDFADWETGENENGDISVINVSFDPVTAIEANHPYIIKTTAATYPFIVERVNIAADEEPCTEVRHSSRIRSYMYGTYAANTVVPDLGLFLANNKFWYSTGKTKMKAFRAYFELFDVLSSVENAGAKISFSIGGTPTSIEGVSTKVEAGNDDIYSVSGMNVGKNADRLQRGVYIVNGKKVVKK